MCYFFWIHICLVAKNQSTIDHVEKEKPTKEYKNVDF